MKWPERREVHRALGAWAHEQGALRPEILRVGYIGSYARGDWGVGSDLDLIVILDFSREPFWRRTLDWDPSSIPVPVDLLIYTRQEWGRMAAGEGRFYQTVIREAIWVYHRWTE